MGEKQEEDLKIRKIRGRNSLFYSNLAKQLLLNVSYMVMAFAQGIRGPTLMDLQEVYETSLEVISLNFTASAIGGIIGSFCIGYIWSWYHHRKHLVMFVVLVVCAASTAVLAHSMSIWPFFVVSVIHGAFCTAVHVVASVLCLEIWADGDFNSSPFMHSLHFCCSIGFLLSPIVAKPFLSSKVYDSNDDNNGTDVEYMHNSSSSATMPTEDNMDGTNIHYLYPLTGLTMLVLSFGYAYLALKEGSKHEKAKEAHTISQRNFPSMTRNILIFLLFLFVIFMCAIDFSLITYIPAFAVKSSYSLTKSEGANLLTIYLAAYCASRVSGVFLAMKFTPRQLLIFPNCVFTVAGAILLLIGNEHHYLVTQIGFGVVGYGMGSVVANMWMWLGGFTEVTGKISSYLNIGGNLGINVAPLVVGQLIESEPMVLTYLLVAVILISVVTLSTGDWVGRKLVREKDIHSSTEDIEEEEKVLDLRGKHEML